MIDRIWYDARIPLAVDLLCKINEALNEIMLVLKVFPY